MFLKEDTGFKISIVRLIGLGVMAPLYMFPRVEFGWLLITFLILWSGSSFYSRGFFRNLPVNRSVILLVSCTILSVIVNSSWSSSYTKLSGIIFSVMLFYSLSGFLVNRKILVLFCKFAALMLTVFALIGWMGMFTFRVKHFGWLERMKDIMPKIDFGLSEGFHPNAIGGALIILLPLLIALSIRAIRKKAGLFVTLLYIVTTGFTGAVVLMTQSRGAWAGLILSFAFLSFIRIKNKKIVVYILILILLSTASVPFLINNSSVNGALEQTHVTLKFRFHLWMIAVPIVFENPFLGIGINNFRDLPEVKHNLSHPHNSMMNVLVESGFGAVIAYLGLIIVLAGMCWYVWRSNAGGSFERYGILGLAAGQLAYFFYGFTDSIPLGSKVGVFFWISAALITGFYRLTIYNEGTIDS